jgi:hypothetical protein
MKNKNQSTETTLGVDPQNAILVSVPLSLGITLPAAAYDFIQHKPNFINLLKIDHG